MSWGTELWDKYEDLCGFTHTGIDFLESRVAEFIKERGKVEKEYARNLRSLVKKYMPKNSSSGSNSKVNQKNNDKSNQNSGLDSGPASIIMRAEAEEEFTHMLAFQEVS